MSNHVFGPQKDGGQTRQSGNRFRPSGHIRGGDNLGTKAQQKKVINKKLHHRKSENKISQKTLYIKSFEILFADSGSFFAADYFPMQHIQRALYQCFDA